MTFASHPNLNFEIVLSSFGGDPPPYVHPWYKDAVPRAATTRAHESFCDMSLYGLAHLAEALAWCMGFHRLLEDCRFSLLLSLVWRCEGGVWAGWHFECSILYPVYSRTACGLGSPTQSLQVVSLRFIGCGKAAGFLDCTIPWPHCDSPRCAVPLRSAATRLSAPSYFRLEVRRAVVGRQVCSVKGGRRQVSHAVMCRVPPNDEVEDGRVGLSMDGWTCGACILVPSGSDGQDRHRSTEAPRVAPPEESPKSHLPLLPWLVPHRAIGRNTICCPAEHGAAASTLTHCAHTQRRSLMDLPVRI